MTTVIFRVLDGPVYEMRVQGHTGFAEIGKDPVCAGASLLAMTVAQCVDLVPRDRLRKKPHITIGGGNVRVVASPKPDAANEIAHIMYVAQVGYQLLAASYPDNVRLKEVIAPAKA